jgi:hypothetical protein
MTADSRARLLHAAVAFATIAPQTPKLRLRHLFLVKYDVAENET